MSTTGIYKITNKTNNKCYIGQSVNIEKRWYNHKYSYKNSNTKDYNSTFHTALRKYGINNFSFEIIEECDIDSLNEREIYWIEFYNSYYRGYNETPGGDNGFSCPGESNPNASLTEDDVYQIRQAVLKCLPQKQFFEDNNFESMISYRQFCRIWRGEGWEHILPEAIEFVKSEEYIQQIRKNARATTITDKQKEAWKDIEIRKLRGEKRSQVYQIYKNDYTQGGFDSIWYKIRENTNPLKKRVVKLDKDTLEELDVYESTADAGRKNGCDSSGIAKVCRGVRNICGGYKWKYVD